MIHSMTGFAVQSCDVAGAHLNLELRSVNARFLDLFFRVGEELRASEPMLREHITARLKRGKVECRLSLQPRQGGERSLAVNRALLQQLALAQQSVRARFPDAASLGVGEILRWPGVLAEDTPDAEAVQSAILALIRSALEDLIASRAREGQKLTAMIRERLAQMRTLVAQVEPRVPQIVAEHQERLATRLRDAAASLDEDRIRQEMAMFAQRIDVAEELNRLVAHIEEVDRVLAKGGAAGKRLDFLMQELNREANTLASKSAAGDVSSAAMEMKVLIEQMREQVQNIE